MGVPVSALNLDGVSLIPLVYEHHPRREAIRSSQITSRIVPSAIPLTGASPHIPQMSSLVADMSGPFTAQLVPHPLTPPLTPPLGRTLTLTPLRSDASPICRPSSWEATRLWRWMHRSYRIMHRL